MKTVKKLMGILCLLVFCSGCVPALPSMESVKNSLFKPTFDGDVGLLKDDVVVTKTDYEGSGKYQNYEISVPYEVSGTLKKDIADIPVRYCLEADSVEATADAALHTETDPMYSVMEDSFTLREGETKGCLTIKTDYAAMALVDGPDACPYIWVSIQLDDTDNTNDFISIHNPYFKGEFPGREITDFDYLETSGDIRIDAGNVTLEKGKEKDGVPHYVLSVPIEADGLSYITEQELNIGSDFGLYGISCEEDNSEGVQGALLFQEGISFGFRQQVPVGASFQEAVVKLDVCNRFAAAEDETGEDIDHYPYLWVAIGAIDGNTNNNYYVLRNPFFDDDYVDSSVDVRVAHGYDTEWNRRYENLKAGEEAGGEEQ